MKKTAAVFAIIALTCLTVSAWADDSYLDVTWRTVAFDSVLGGGLTYNASGGDVVSDTASAFRTAMGSVLSVQKIGGDGENNPVEGNFAFFAAFAYTDTDNVFAWAQSIPNTPLAIEWGAHTLYFDNGMNDYFAFDARDMSSVDYLTATFAEMGAWGCTEIAPGMWMDIAVDTVMSQVAISIVGFYDLGIGNNNLNTYINAGLLDNEDPSTSDKWRASGFSVAEIPEPATMCLLGLGVLMCRKFKKA